MINSNFYKAIEEGLENGQLDEAFRTLYPQSMNDNPRLMALEMNLLFCEQFNTPINDITKYGGTDFAEFLVSDIIKGGEEYRNNKKNILECLAQCDNLQKLRVWISDWDELEEMLNDIEKGNVICLDWSASQSSNLGGMNADFIMCLDIAIAKQKMYFYDGVLSSCGTRYLPLNNFEEFKINSGVDNQESLSYVSPRTENGRVGYMVIVNKDNCVEAETTYYGGTTTIYFDSRYYLAREVDNLTLNECILLLQHDTNHVASNKEYFDNNIAFTRDFTNKEFNQAMKEWSEND